MKNFDVNKLSGEEAKAIVRNLLTPFQANIQRQQVSSEKLISTLVIDLSIERTRSNALKISFPFISVRVEEATDLTCSCKIIPVDISDYQDDTILKLNDSLEFDNGISNVFITNISQPNKKMVLKFFTTGRVRSGSFVIDQNSSARIINTGGISFQDNDFNCFLTGTISSGSSLLAVRSRASSPLFCKNNPQYNSGNNFIVPLGFEFVVTSFTKINKFNVPSVEIGATVIGCSQVSNTFAAGTYLENDSLFEKIFVSTSTFTDSVYNSPLSSLDDVALNFPFPFADSTGGNKLCIIDQGKSVVVFLNNFIGQPTITNTNIDITVSGYLRRII